jgi:ABC-type transport system involved in multi-copper enzyme maturation permease subunit
VKGIDALAGWSWNNPVTLKELRIGLRERRIFILQVVYLCFLLLISLMYLPNMFSTPNSEQLAERGKDFFNLLFGLQLMLLLVTAPALTCGSLSSERERHSLDMVLASRITSGQLVAGKLGFAAYCLVLLLASALPLASICFFLGGITLGEALASYFELFLFGMLAASVGLFSSARESRSNYATVQSYLLVLLSSFLILPYMAFRLDDRGSSHLVVGPYPWTFNQVWELTVFHFFVGLALYLISFFFVKARHRVRAEARNLNAMSILFLLLYLFCLAWLAGLYSLAYSGSANQDEDPLAIVLYMAHIGFLGFFLNPNNLDSRMEQNRFRSSPFSRPIFWLGLSLIGCLAPWAILHLQSITNHFGPGSLAFTLFFLCVYPLSVGFFQRAWLPRWQYAWVYYLGLVLLQFFPALGSFGSESRDSLWRMNFVAPFSTLLSLGDWNDRGSYAVREETLIYAVCFHLFLLLVLGAVYRWRTRGRVRAGA